jgi:hypothetical protein
MEIGKDLQYGFYWYINNIYAFLLIFLWNTPYLSCALIFQKNKKILWRDILDHHAFSLASVTK